LAFAAASPPDGCTLNDGVNLRGKVLLAIRGVCPFYDKYIVALKAGARALVVADSAPTTDSDAKLIGLIRGGAPIHNLEITGAIPAWAVHKYVYDELSATLGRGERLRAAHCPARR
jgi:hypothetical protein